MSEEIYAKLGREYGLAPSDVREIGDAIASAHGLVTAEDFAAGMASIVNMYTAALGDTAATFPPEHQETARIVIDRAVEVIVARLEQSQTSTS